MLRRVSLSAFSLCWLLAHSAPSFAQSTDPAAADLLFREARELVNQEKLSEACPKFLESQRLDPATGTLLAVANCHEAEGRLATAWAEYSEVVARAEQEGRLDRVELAKELALALEPRLSTLKIVAAPELLRIAGLSVRRNGVEMSQAALNSPLPVDGGKQDVELGAPGYLPEQLTIVVEPEGDRVVMALPMLRPIPVEAPTSSVESPAPGVLPPPVASAALEPSVVAPESMTLERSVTWSLAGATAVCATLTSIFLVAAWKSHDQFEDVRNHPEAPTAGSRLLELQAQGQTAQARARVFGVLTATLGVATGVGVWWTTRLSGASRGEPAAGGVGALGATWSGQF